MNRDVHHPSASGAFLCTYTLLFILVGNVPLYRYKIIAQGLLAFLSTMLLFLLAPSWKLLENGRFSPPRPLGLVIYSDNGLLCVWNGACFPHVNLFPTIVGQLHGLVRAVFTLWPSKSRESKEMGWKIIANKTQELEPSSGHTVKSHEAKSKVQTFSSNPLYPLLKTNNPSHLKVGILLVFSLCYEEKSMASRP